MSSTSFHQHAWLPDLNEAFAEAFRTARADYGTAGETGSLAEKHGVVVIDEHQPLSAADAWDLADELLDSGDTRVAAKWGPAGAIPMSRQTNDHRHVCVTARIVGPMSDRDTFPDHVLASLLRDRAQNECGEGEHVIGVEISARNFETSVVQTSTGSVAGTAYRVGDRVFASIVDAEAHVERLLAHAVNDLDSSGHQSSTRTRFEIEAISVTETGSPVVEATELQIDQITVHGTATLSRPAANPPVDGWLFFGWADC